MLSLDLWTEEISRGGWRNVYWPNFQIKQERTIGFREIEILV